MTRCVTSPYYVLTTVPPPDTAASQTGPGRPRRNNHASSRKGASTMNLNMTKFSLAIKKMSGRKRMNSTTLTAVLIGQRTRYPP